MQYDNYESDSRVRAANRRKWYSSLDQKKMTALALLCDENGDEELLEVSFEWEVCPTCDGKGRHVNPSIDCNGISAQDFADDPEFREDYCKGRYDVACYNCGGLRVVPVTSDERVLESEKEQREYERIAAAERRMGC